MKIAYLIDHESLGGGCEYIQRKSAADRARGDEVRVFYSDDGTCRAAVLDAWGADFIVVNHLKALLQVLGRPWEHPRGKVRMVVHGIHLRKYAWYDVRGLFRRALEAYLYHRCDELVALTETDRADLLWLYGKGLKVVVEPNTLEDWTPDLSSELPPGIEGPFQYICIGRFDAAKGQDRWIRQIRGRTLFIGEGERLAACKRLATKLSVADLCVFAGAIPHADRYLKCADIVVSPSRWEGLPYLMLKARALGCSILATDCPGNREALKGYDKWEKLVIPYRNRLMSTEKALLDFALSVLLLIFSSPLFIVIPLLIKLTSKGPVFYKAHRLGQNGRAISVFKFRTMYQDAEQRLNPLLAADSSLKAEFRHHFKLKDDPRVTPLGRLLRKTSLDELPQLFNVFRGEMALVGPRPIVEREVPYYGTDYATFSSVKPGITGLWQVSGRNDMGYARRVALDLIYVHNWTPWLDLGILFKTIFSVLLMRGAY